MNKNSDPKVTICIVSWNTVDLLRKCIRSINIHTNNTPYEVVVVDNGSNDKTVDIIKTEYPWVKVYASSSNLGFVKGNNKAVSMSSGEYLLFLNPDTELLTDVVSGLSAFLDTHDDYGAVGCKITYPDGNIQNTCAATFPTPWNVFSQYFLLNKLFKNIAIFSSRELDYWDHEGSRDIDCLSGACMMVRKNIFVELGGFDENIFMYAEDLDICFNIKKYGKKIYYLPNEILIHHHGASSKLIIKRSFTSILQQHYNQYFIVKNYGYYVGLKIKFVVFAGSMFRIFILLPLVILSYALRDKHKYADCVNSFNKHYGNMMWSIGMLGVNKYLKGIGI